jgi:serine/threonine-protein kinase
MELLRGETLEDRMARQRADRLAAMDWILRVLEPLAAAHAQSIVHRDLKPANVFIACAADGTEQVKLLDFGLARDTREKSGTETGIAMGTPYYMSPEQATRPKEVGPASDVWSIGVMMYEVLSGCMPFEGETLHAVVIQSTTTQHVPLATHQPRLDSELCDLVEDCLCKEPAQRPADASELLARLSPLLENTQLRGELADPTAGTDAESGSLSPLTLERMPFADTAISLTPRLLESDTRRSRPRSSGGLWFSALTLLALAVAGFLWALERADSGSMRRELPRPSASGPAAVAPTNTRAAPLATEARQRAEARVAAPNEPLPRGTNDSRGPRSLPAAANEGAPALAMPQATADVAPSDPPPTAAEAAREEPSAESHSEAAAAQPPAAEAPEMPPSFEPPATTPPDYHLPNELPPPDPPEPYPAEP